MLRAAVLKQIDTKNIAFNMTGLCDEIAKEIYMQINSVKGSTLYRDLVKSVFL